MTDREFLELVQAYRVLCAEVAVNCSIRTGRCPPAFFFSGRDGHLHYGCMQLYDPEPQRIRAWLLASECDFGFVVGSVNFGMPEPVYAGIYLRCELKLPRGPYRRRVAEKIVFAGGDPVRAIRDLSSDGWKNEWMPGYMGPPDLPPIYKSMEPLAPKIGRLSPIRSVLSDTGAERESAFLETVDEVLRKKIGIPGMT